MDPHLRRARADPVDEREGLFAGQCGRGGVLRPSQAGVLPQEELPGRDDRRVHRDARRVHGLVPRQAHQDRIRHEHHGQTHPARARRLKPSGTLTNDHTDNEVQQNVTTPQNLNFLLNKNRSMSAKGCSPDNAAAEGFFGRLKNEFFYGRDWRGVGYEEFRERLSTYLTHLQ